MGFDQKKVKVKRVIIKWMKCRNSWIESENYEKI